MSSHLAASRRGGTVDVDELRARLREARCSMEALHRILRRQLSGRDLERISRAVADIREVERFLEGQYPHDLPDR